MSKETVVLFLDDDIEIKENFIEAHFSNLAGFKADASIGSIVESHSGSLKSAIKISKAAKMFNGFFIGGLIDRVVVLSVWHFSAPLASVIDRLSAARWSMRG